MLELDVELIIQLEAFDETYSQAVHSRTSYRGSEIVWGAKFLPILGHEGRYSTLDLSNLGSYEKSDLPDI